ncbi:zinc finger domain-containing protein [Streptosporangium sandarakinum]
MSVYHPCCGSCRAELQVRHGDTEVTCPGCGEVRHINTNWAWVPSPSVPPASP